MIPTKLYIPTSTLNFNNIMSSESISPVSFYERRGFGYKRFTKVEPNNLVNRILLYEKYPVFDIHDQELENYPLVIEIDTNHLNEDVVQEQNGSFFADETIYLNPFTTKIFFRNEQGKISTLSKAEPSIETKMVALYKNCFLTKPKEIESIVCSKINIEDSIADNSKFISKDRKINKLKGLLYAYLLAANKSVSSDVVSLKKYARNLQNTLSAVITSPDGRANYRQETELKSLYKAINDKFQSVILAPVLKEKAELYKCEFAEILRKENLFESWLHLNNYSKYQITEFYAPKDDKDKAFDKYVQTIDNQIESLENNQRKSKIGIIKLPALQNNKVFQIPEPKKEFLTKLFNEYLEEAYNSDDFIQSRYEFAKSGGKVFKDELQTQWDGSPSQQYINALLKNLNEYSAFDIKSTNNLTLESFAAFCQKGESDVEKLEDYLVSNEIGDFRIAFSLWGIIFGFAGMPKTLTNDLFLLDDLDYISEIYKYIYKQVHGIELEGKFVAKKAPITSRINEPKTEQQLVQTPPIVQPDNSDSDIVNRLVGCKLKPEQIESIREIYKNNHFLTNDKFFANIKKIKGIGDKALEKIKNVLGCENKSSIIKSKTTENNSLFGEMRPEIGSMFYKDSGVWYHIQSLIPQDKQKKVKTEIDWIQKVYRENGYKKKSGEWVKLDDNSNQAVIKHFENNSKNRIDSNLMKQIISKLKELYL